MNFVIELMPPFNFTILEAVSKNIQLSSSDNPSPNAL